MITLIVSIFVRIISNSYLNVFQKLLTNNSERPSVVNFYTYLGLSLSCVFFVKDLIFSIEILQYFFIMGFLGALGNYFIIKALSCGELSTLAPINSYKPIVALVFGIFLLKEIPHYSQLLGIFLILIGTLFLSDRKFYFSKSCGYRFLALFFSAMEAIFIKKIIILSNVLSAFVFWCVAGLIFSLILVIFSRNRVRISQRNVKYQLGLVFMVGLMQYSTNFVFSKMNVAYALALFQLSSLLSVFLGVNLFKEEDLLRKVVASLIMIIGAIIIIVY